MKTYKSLLLIALFFTGNAAFTQKTVSGNGNVVEKRFNNSNFNHIEVSGSMDVTLIPSTTYSVAISADENLFDDNIFVEQINNILRIGSRNIQKATQMKATISLPDIIHLQASGASEIRTAPENFKLDVLTIKLSGASKAELNLECTNFITSLLGASTLKISGTSKICKYTVSGASDLRASDFVADKVYVTASGASKACVQATDLLSYISSGASDIKFNTMPYPRCVIEKGDSECHSVYNTSGYDYSDSTQVNVGGLKIKVVEKADSTKVSVGRLEVVVGDNNYVDISRKPKSEKRKFNGHWSGIDLGINGWLTPDFDMNFKDGLEYMDLRMEKSINVNLNLIEQNFTLNKKGNFGVYTGLGFSWNNYRFSNDVLLKDELGSTVGYIMEGVSVRKSKLVNTYFTVPLLFEIQNKRDNLFFAAGVIGGLRILSHTKVYFDDSKQEYILTDILTGEQVGETQKTPKKRYRNIEKEYDGFHMNAFKLDASVRAGWSVVKLYFNYSLTPLFSKDKGPEVYPFAAGISFSL
ncbi:MAG: DUF2807 domain-containing protein [Lentimicrobiaceae bacterium]|jgi:hypothetical protein|nr:DUF2807 domain-containing protein [Lentimicrobiaceae bacterium]